MLAYSSYLYVRVCDLCFVNYSGDADKVEDSACLKFQINTMQVLEGSAGITELADISLEYKEGISILKLL